MTQTLEILVVHAEVPMADRNSLSVRLVELLALMAREGHRVTLLARCAPPGHEDHAARLRAAGVEIILGDPERAVAAGWPATGRPLDLPALLRRPWDVIWLSEYGVAEQYGAVVRASAPLARVVADSGDVAWVREQRGAELSGDPGARAGAARTRAREQAAYANADALVAVSEPDAEALRALVPEARVAVISNIHAPVPSGPPAGARQGAVFVGNFHHAPNVDAILRFHADTWPLVRARLPAARLTVVGTAPPPAVQALAEDPSVTVTGWVPAVRPHLDAARVAIAPLRFGAGVKGKVGEALAAGLPVVGTTLALEGMPLRDGEEVLVADDPERFAAAIAQLERDEALWERLAAAGRACISKALGRDAARTALSTLLAGLTPPLWHGDESAVEPYLAAHADGDPATLAITVSTEPAAQAATVARLEATIRRLGRDPERIPDITLVPGAPALPARARPLCSAAPAPARRPPATIALLLGEDPARVRAQLAALAASGLAAEAEIIAVLDGAEPEIAAVARQAAGGLRVLASHERLGRRGAIQRAAAAARGEALIVLDPLTDPAPGLLAALLAALGEGAALAAPVIDGRAGWRRGPEGTLLPADPGAPPDALGFDCLAARTELWLEMPDRLPAAEGFAELQLGAWAQAHGGLTVAASACATRAATPPATVVICSHNRAGELEPAVASLLADGFAGEIVIVDNASTDATAQIGAELARRHPGLVRLVAEPRPGLSHARNAGLHAAAHELVIFLDDDARPAPGWLAHLTSGLGRPGVSVAGGPIRALWPDSRPSHWPPPGVERLFGVLDLGDADRDLDPSEHVYGGNWAVRRTALRALGGFDPAYGVSPTTRLGGEEIDAADRLLRAGAGTRRWVARAAVGHIIGEARMPESAIVRRSLLGGVERACRQAGEPVAPRRRRAAQALAVLAQRVPLHGELELEQALERLTGSDWDLTQRTLAADLLGEVAGTTALLGEGELCAAALRLRVRPEHARGLLRAA